MYTGMILIDLQKAFDTINHKILLNKLLAISFSKNTIGWYESYLAERHFTVEVANRVSKFENISCGVPEGSVLGPLLFLIYVNDMSQAVECDLHLYVDDSCLLFQHQSVTEIKKTVNQSLLTYLPTYLPTHVPTYLPTYLLTYLNVLKLKNGRRRLFLGETCSRNFD